MLSEPLLPKFRVKKELAPGKRCAIPGPIGIPYWAETGIAENLCGGAPSPPKVFEVSLEVIQGPYYRLERIG